LKNTQITASTSFLKLQLILLLWLVICSIDVCAQTTASFTINKQSGCVPLSSVNFVENSTGDRVIRRDWNLGNGTIITNGNQTVGTNYLTAKTFYVTLTVTFANGDVKTKKESVVVHPKPIASFEADDTAGCIPHRVNFTDRSSTETGTIRKWTWDFGSGGTTVQNPAFVYNATGNYNVSLIVENSWGCESDAASRFQYMRVYSSPVAFFLPSATVSCEDTLTIKFNNQTTGAALLINTNGISAMATAVHWKAHLIFTVPRALIPLP
jgi:PKD repeat protein